ncbi:MAG: N-acetylneuraminate synthase [Acidiferrobacteraceae bacterium]|nr:N-acetylneuraminate synthase [Acidiferrobacteraceae bacterium]|tara:strand:- start:1084 stop:2130 length:1047 start_codon:yes stop_codon:yes gene_type:complete
MAESMFIGEREVGENAPCLVIAEIGLVHDGSLGAAHAFIDAIATTGADAVKFQTHIASAESSPSEAFRVDVFPQDETRYDYWERTSFTEKQWAGLKQHAEDKNLIFMSTPFSIEAVEMLRRIGVKAWKIGSGETNNILLLDEIAKGNELVLLSSGMSYLHELEISINSLKDKNVPLLLMQCTSRYPCPPEKLGLNMISDYEKRFQIPVGFSDHSGEVGPSLAAVAMGSKAIEVHVTWHPGCFGPDVKASLTIEELSLLTKNIRIIETALSNPIDKDLMAEEMSDMRLLFTKGLVAKKDIAKGEIINIDHIDIKKPCTGIPVNEYEKIIGKSTVRYIAEGESIDWKDIR